MPAHKHHINPREKEIKYIILTVSSSVYIFQHLHDRREDYENDR